MSMKELVTSWENAVEGLENNEAEVTTAAVEEAADDAENLFEGARW